MSKTIVVAILIFSIVTILLVGGVFSPEQSTESAATYQRKRGLNSEPVIPDETAAPSDTLTSTDLPETIVNRTVWPVSVEEMESSIYDALAPSPNVVVINSVSCDGTQCEVTFVHREIIFDMEAIFGHLADGISSGTRPGEAGSGVYESTVKLSGNRDNPFPDNGFSYRIPAEELTSIADRVLTSDAYDEPPVTLGNIDGGALIAENVCSVDCPLDTQRVIHIDVPDNTTCEQLRGVEQDILVRLSSGSLQGRTFCVPNTLVGN